MPYDGTSKLGDAIAALYGCSPRSHNKIAGLIAEAKASLGITSKAKNLPDADKLAIYRWHVGRLDPVQNVKQVGLNGTGTAQALADAAIEPIQPPDEPEALPPVSLSQDGAPDKPVYDVKQDDQHPIADDGNHSRPDDYGQIHFAVSFSHQGQTKRTTVMLEGYLVKALQRRHGLTDNTAIRAWIGQAIKADGERFDSAMPLTKQVKRMIIESFV